MSGKDEIVANNDVCFNQYLFNTPCEGSFSFSEITNLLNTATFSFVKVENNDIKCCKNHYII
jgi:hypothetical protein